MKLAITGHRPHKLNNEYDLYGPVSTFLKEELTKILRALKPEEILTGMALGVDQLFALIAINEGIKVHASIPCANHESRWPRKSRELYHKILKDDLVQVYMVDDGPYAPWKMQKRNQYMVDKCDKLIAVWDGSSGGTANCIKYAQEVGRDILFIDPSEVIKKTTNVQ